MGRHGPGVHPARRATTIVQIAITLGEPKSRSRFPIAITLPSHPPLPLKTRTEEPASTLRHSPARSSSRLAPIPRASPAGSGPGIVDAASPVKQIVFCEQRVTVSHMFFTFWLGCALQTVSRMTEEQRTACLKGIVRTRNSPSPGE